MDSGPYIAISECITGPPKHQVSSVNKLVLTIFQIYKIYKFIFQVQNSSLVFSFSQSQRHRFTNSSSVRENDKHSRSYVNTAKMFDNSNNFTRNTLRSSDQPPRLPENIYQNAENVVTCKVQKGYSFSTN